MSNIQQLFPIGKDVTVGDEIITIKPFKFGQIPKVFQIINPISQSIFDAISDSQGQLAAIGQLVATGGEPIVELIVIGTGKPRQWVDQLEIDQGIDLLTAVLEVNASFFVQKVLPKLNQAMEAINQKQDGKTSS